MITIKQAIDKLQKAKNKIRQAQRNFFSAKADRYQAEARRLTQEVVYNTYAPKQYRRAGMSGGLLGAVEVACKKDGNGADIFVNQEKTDILSKPKRRGEGRDWKQVRDFEAEGAKSYAQHIVEGTGIFSEKFVRRFRSGIKNSGWLGKRDFVDRWYHFFGQTIPREYFEEVVKGSLRKAGFKG